MEKSILTLVDQLAALIEVPIDPTSRAAVADALGRLLAQAEVVASFPLPNDVQVSPVFRP